jgi:NAD-dependent DNA ligase
MPSPKLIQILRSRSGLTDEQIISLSEKEAWDLIYEIDAKQKEERNANRKPTVCFTGFNKTDKAAIEAKAIERGMKPVTSISQSLNYLVLGETPGPSKVSKAEAAGVRIIQAHEFDQLPP